MKEKASVSVFCSILFGGLLYLLCDMFQLFSSRLEVAVFSGTLFGLLLFPCLILLQKREEKKYGMIERTFASPVFFKTNGNFHLGNRVRNGNIYFCDTGIIFVSLDEKPYMLEELKCPEIESYGFGDFQIMIQAADGRVFLITLKEMATVRNALKTRGWIQ